MGIYDLAIIGSGTAAMVAAMRMRSAGWRVAVVDHKPFGGTCALLYAGTGSLAAVIALHALYNASIKIPEWIVYHSPLS